MSFQERINRARSEIHQEGEKKRKEKALRDVEHRSLTNEGMDAARNRQADRYDELRALGLIDLIEEVTSHRVIVSRPVSPEDQKKASQIFDSKFRKISDEELKKVFDKTNVAMQWDVTISTPSLSERGVWDTSLKIFITKREAYDRPPERTAIIYHDPSKRLRIIGRQTTFWGPIPEGNKGKEVLEDSLAKAFADPDIGRYRPKEVPPHSHFGPDQKLRQ